MGDVVIDSVGTLWSRYAGMGDITEHDFHEYYAGYERGVAFVVGRVLAFAEPLPLAALGVATPPQSFMYVKRDVLDDLQQRSMAAVLTRGRL